MNRPDSRRYLGIDVGAETIKLAELVADGRGMRWTRPDHTCGRNCTARPC